MDAISFLNKNGRISFEISLKFVLKGSIANIPALVQIMAWRHPGDKPLSEPMMISLPAHICVTRPQWMKCLENLDRLSLQGYLFSLNDRSYKIVDLWRHIVTIIMQSSLSACNVWIVSRAYFVEFVSKMRSFRIFQSEEHNGSVISWAWQ